MIAQAQRLAEGAGEILLGHYGSLRRGDADRKGTPRDLVSRADLDAERYLADGIPAADDILGEEGTDRDTGAARKWVIDPLDGTVNFLHGIPFWCVSIGVIEHGALAAGVVHAPALKQTWTAVAGGGCRLNGRPVTVSGTRELAEAIVATGFAYRRNELADKNFDNFQAIGLKAAGIRRLGAAAIDMALLASGTLDGFWELHLNAWDVAAGTLLVREAGGVVTDFAGSEALDDVLFGRNIVAGNVGVHDEIRALLRPRRDR